MTSISPVANDSAAVERLAYALFRQAADADDARPSRLARLHAAALNPDRLEAVNASAGQPPIPLAYHLWLAHLLWLEEVVHTLACRPADLTAAELAGLQALGRARARFVRQHRFCPHCDAANPRLGPGRCRRCQKEL